MVIVDAAVSRGTAPGQLGGTGERVDWTALARAGMLPVPMAVAGGLTPENVAEAVRVTGLSAVDTASGVEAAPGQKDPQKVRDFIAAARQGMEGLR
jgi:phosphoribosylanthranilate isomerase